MTGWTVDLDGVVLSGGDDEALGCLSVPPAGLGHPALRTEDVEFPQRDGVRHYSDWYEPRIITLEDVAVCRDDCADCMSARQKVREISRAWGRRCDDVELVIWPDCDAAVAVRRNLLIHRPDWVVTDPTEPGWAVAEGNYVETFRVRLTDHRDDLTGYRLAADEGVQTLDARYRITHSEVEDGQTYTVSMWARQEPQSSGTLTIGDDEHALSDEWFRYSTTLTADEGTEIVLAGEADPGEPEQVLRTNYSENPRNTGNPEWQSAGPETTVTRATALPTTPPGTNLRTGAAATLGPDEATVERTNLYWNPSFETVVPETAGGGAVLARDAAWAASGTQSLRITPNGSSTASAAYLWGTEEDGFNLTGMQRGQTYTLSATFRLASTHDGTTGRSIQVGHTVGDTQNFAYAESDRAPTSPGETRLSVTFTVPEEGFLFVRLRNASATVPVWWDAVLLEEGDTAGTYFDGDTPTDGTTLYRWTGEPHQSSSEQYTAAASPAYIARVTGIDGLGAEAPARRVGVWVHPSVPGTRTRIGGDSGGNEWVDTPAGSWTWVMGTELIAGAAGGTVEVVRDEPAPAGTVTYLTGSFVTYEPDPGDEVEPWSFLLIPDTQRMANADWNLQGYFNGMRDWIIANRERFNVQFIGGLGDIIDRYNDAESWAVAETALDPLFDLPVPVLLLASGNHDSDTANQRLRSLTGYNSHFGIERYQNKDWYGGVYEAGKAQNMYARFAVAGNDYLVFMLEFHPRAGVYEWVDDVVRDNPDTRVLILTHSFLNPDGTRDDWLTDPWGPRRYFTRGMDDATAPSDAWFDPLRYLPGLFGVFSGHHLEGNVSYRNDPGAAGNAILQGFYNWQEERLDGQPVGGRGRVILMTVDEQRGTIRQQVVRPDIDSFEEAANSGFPYSALHSVFPAEEGAAPPFFDGSTEPYGEMRYRWLGEPGASPSEEYVPATEPSEPVVEVAGIMIEEGSSLGDYFDGSTTNTPGHRYGWEGEPDQSTSFAQQSDDPATTGPFGVIGRPRAMEVEWMPSNIGCANLLLRFDAVDQRIYILDPSGEPGSGTECVTVQPVTSSKCRTYPRCYPLCYDEETGEDPGDTSAFNIGDFCVYPTITLWGRLTNPSLENLTTGQTVRYRGTINETDPPVIIDTEAGTATQGGVSRTHLLEGDARLLLDPGENMLRLLSFSSNDNGEADVCWRATVGVV